MWKLYTGDCLNILPTLEADSIDTCITDPPYGLKFMGKDWDKGVPGVHFWQEVYRVLKPGAMLLAFGGTRTWHRLTCAIEDAGFGIRDCLMWLYSSGFPKSHDISKAIDKAAGEKPIFNGYKPSDRPNSTGNKSQSMNGAYTRHVDTLPATEAAQLWNGWGTALKPAWEPIIVAMKPLDGTFAQNAIKWNVAGLWIDGGRIPFEPADRNQYEVKQKSFNGATSSKFNVSPQEPFDIRVGHSSNGRWPANLVLDEEAAAMLDEMSGERRSGGRKGPNPSATDALAKAYKGGWKQTGGACEASTGGASRFFYCAKASRSEREAGLEGMEEMDKAFDSLGFDETKRNRQPRTSKTSNHHPCVKPISLMRYLARLTKTPTGGVVLDPFAGSGSTGIGAILEGRDFIGIELSEEYAEIARRRIEHAASQARQLELING